MKTDDLQELKPVYIHEACYSADDEISLIDLAMVLVHRKVMIATIFIAFIALGVSVTLFTPKTYTFSTTIEIGSQIINHAIVPFETPQALLAKLQHVYIPKILGGHRQSNSDDKKTYQIKASVPSGSNILLLEVNGTKDQADTLQALLQKITQEAIQDHSRIFQSVKTTTEARLNQAINNIKLLKNSENNKIEIAMNQSIIESLTPKLANLQNTRQVLPPASSLNPTGSSRKTIVIVSAFTGIFIGVFAAFFTGFLSKVKQKIGEED